MMLATRLTLCNSLRTLRTHTQLQLQRNLNWTTTRTATATTIGSMQINKRFFASSIIKETTESPAATGPTESVAKAPLKGRVKTLPQVDEPLETALSPSRTRALRKKRLAIDELSALGFLKTRGYTTADEYNLEELHAALRQQNLYETKRFFSTDNLGVEQNVLFVTAKYPTGEQPREIFFFREGSVVFWNCTDIETNNVLNFLRSFERESYVSALVHGESEMMPYTYIASTAVDVEGDPVVDSSGDLDVASRAFFQNGKFYVTPDSDNFLYKYTFSNAIAQSIKLGLWEATLDRYIDSMEYLTEDLKRGRRLRISRAAMLRKTGELFALRHSINLSSDLLDAPDFYWDREELEGLYLQVCSYFSISRRTKVMNEKINHCVELAELVSHNLNDAHHIRLEWMIIILIMVEVGFEILHFVDGAFHQNEAVTAYPISQDSA
ncbi:required for meiotic nuclear division protein 1 homolog [Drosophila sulfurigaster albostrigata]|uniref:required for meiotic nuclear division protein 1 homolog n=1 Tax=Drosophila sulfurigaster albostrigata TaxID=89887 RepID=UPI002D218D40|nr:required for meiotic nuclear division protein 1 homolog [Drosophila sulfurigaster albostrigata]